MRRKADTIIYDEVVLFGIPALFTDWRIDRNSVPEGLHLYEIRHTDEDWGHPCQLARGILVNFYGSLLTAAPISIPDSGYLDFREDDFINVISNCGVTTKEFQAKHRGGSYAQYCL